MRGPVMMRRKSYDDLGGLDFHSFFLAYDEHDLFLRAHLHLGMSSAFHPIVFNSPLEWGTTRRPRSIETELLIVQHLLRIRRARSKSALSLVKFEQLEYPTPAIREIN